MSYFIQALASNTLSAESEVARFLLDHGRVFQYPAFLNQVSSQWTALVLRQEEEILAVLPLVLSKRAGIQAAFIPQHAHVYGPVFSHEGEQQKASVVEALLKYTQKHALIEWKLPILDRDLLPFLASGCTVQATQSHLIAQGTVASMNLVHGSKRRYLKKLQQILEQGELQVKTGAACYADLIALQKRTAEKSGFQTNLKVLEKIITGLGEQHAYALVVYTASGEPLSGAFCPFDQHYAYHIINASVNHADSLLNKSNILSAYLAVQQALDKGLGFDFEGSNIPGVAQFYRMMGGVPTVFYRVQKANNWKGKLMFSSLYWK